jgi:hypothetical protein
MAKLPGQLSNKARAMRSGQPRGFVGGEHPLVLRVAKMFAMPHHDILDYGSGKLAQQAQILRQAGHKVTAHDHWGTDPQVAALGLHDPNALQRRYHMVLASNVLNVQGSRRDLAKTLNEIAGAVHPTEGMAIVNFANTPRYDAFKGQSMEQANKGMEVALKRRFHSVERHPITTGLNTPVWICKTPKNPVHPVED